MTVLASILATWKPIRHCDARPGLGSLAAALTALAMLVIQHDEVDRDGVWLLSQPDQKATMAALHHTERIARQEGIARSQLIRLVAPALRSWNMGLMSIPDEFPLMRLVEAPEQVAHPLSDEQVRQCLLRRLSPRERMALGTCSCATRINPSPAAGLQMVSTARPIKLDRVTEPQPGRFRTEKALGRMVYEFDPKADARYLLLPGLKTDQEFNILCRDVKGRWRPARYFRCFPAPVTDKDAVFDLSTMIHLWGEPITQIAVEFSKPGEICLEGPPRLLR